MTHFISEPLKPRGPFNTVAMSRGEPGLPEAFEWHGRVYRVSVCLNQWKKSEREGVRTGGELYLRRHYYELRMSDGSIWVVYFVRQTPRTGSPKARWFLYTTTGAESPGDAERQAASPPSAGQPVHRDNEAGMRNAVSI
jgi:hypothetical protein